MSAAGHSDPRLPRADPSDVRGIQVSGAIQASRPHAGAGLHSAGGFNGQALSVPRRPARTQVSRQLQTYDASTGSTPKVGVTSGQIYSGGSWTPKISGTLLSAATPPTLAVSGGDTVVYIQLDLNSDGVVDDANSVSVASAATMPDNDEFTAYVKLADIEVTAGATASVRCVPVVSGSLSHKRCRQWFTSPAEYTHEFTAI